MCIRDRNTTDLFRTVVQKIKIACMISDIQNGQELSEQEDTASTDTACIIGIVHSRQKKIKLIPNQTKTILFTEL